jgi:hypothetical protein
MSNGRPISGSMATVFVPDGKRQNVDSKQRDRDVSGWQIFSGETKNTLQHGHGKLWMADGRIFMGELEKHKLKQGYLYELQLDGTHTMYHVKYNNEQDSRNSVP